MTPAFSARRRADEFEALLSRGPDAPPAEGEAAAYADLLAVVADLRALPEVTPRAEFTASLRERLMAEADTVLVRQPPAPSRLAMPTTSRSRSRRLGAVLGAAALTGAAATLAVASQSALPGESLYGVKRGIESAEVRFAGDDAARGRELLAQADTRLAEVEALTREGAPAQLVPDTLDDFTRQSSDGVRHLLVSYEATGSADDAQVARDFTARSIERLDALQDQVPAEARDALVAAGLTLTDLDLEVDSVCVGCTGGITETPGFLLTSAPQDLVEGLDPDAVTLEGANEGAPISGQDLTGIQVPEALAPTKPFPSQQSQQQQQNPTVPTTGLPDPTSNQNSNQTSKPDPTKPGRDITKDLTDTVGSTVDSTTTTVTTTTGNLANQLDDVTGGAIGGLTSSVDDATGGLIGEVTGTLDGVTGGLLGNATGGLLPHRP